MCNTTQWLSHFHNYCKECSTLRLVMQRFYKFLYIYKVCRKLIPLSNKNMDMTKKLFMDFIHSSTKHGIEITCTLSGYLYYCLLVRWRRSFSFWPNEGSVYLTTVLTVYIDIRIQWRIQKIGKEGSRFWLSGFYSKAACSVSNNSRLVRMLTIVIHSHDLVNPELLQYTHIIQQRRVTEQETCVHVGGKCI